MRFAEQYVYERKIISRGLPSDKTENLFLHTVYSIRVTVSCYKQP